MGILDKLGIKKEKAGTAAAEAKPETAATAAAIEKKPQAQASPKGNTGKAYQILVRPILSEKGTAAAAAGRYVFAVNRAANKTEIRKAIQKVYDVHVQDVKVVRLPGKKRRSGRSVGMTSGIKKAIVILKAGEKIPGIIESVG